MENYNPSYTSCIKISEQDDHWESLFPKHIETDNLDLQYFADDVPVETALKYFQENSETDKYSTLSYAHPSTYQETLDVYNRIEQMKENNSDMFYSIRLKESNTYVGRATIEDVDLHSGRCGIGVWLRRDFWGQGISQERAEALLYAIFECMPINTVEVLVATENQNSINSVFKYMKEFGGSYEGCMRNKSINANKKPFDKYVWSITEKEFYDEDSDYSSEPQVPEKD